MPPRLPEWAETPKGHDPKLWEESVIEVCKALGEELQERRDMANLDSILASITIPEPRTSKLISESYAYEDRGYRFCCPQFARERPHWDKPQDPRWDEFRNWSENGGLKVRSFTHEDCMGREFSRPSVSYLLDWPWIYFMSYEDAKAYIDWMQSVGCGDSFCPKHSHKQIGARCMYPNLYPD